VYCMNNTISLQKYISQRTMPKIVMMLFICFVVFGLISFYVIQREVQQNHIDNIQLFESSEARFIEGLEHQVSNLAKNDLIINSLIDYENRDSYLPVFFRSLKFTKTGDNAIVFTDFSGEVITGKQTALFETVSDSSEWKIPVLEKGNPYKSYTDKGFLIASPVNYGDLPEGAIVTVLSDFQAAIDFKTKDKDIILVDQYNKIIFTSLKDEALINSEFLIENYLSWSHEIKTVTNGFGETKIISLQPMITAYQQVSWVLVFALLLLFFVFFGNSISVKLAAQLASGLLKEFQHSLSVASSSDEKINPTEVDYPLEFQELSAQYLQLLQNLSTTTLSNDKFQSVLNSLNEMLLVVDSNEQLILENEASEQFALSLKLTMKDNLKDIIPAKYLNRSLPDERLIQSYNVYDPQGACYEDKYISWTRSDFLQMDSSYSGSVFIGTDVTQAKQLEEQLNIKNIAVDEAETSIVIIDIETDEYALNYVNTAFETLSGYEKSDVLGQNYLFLLGDDSDPYTLTRIMTAVENRQTTSEIILNYRKNGSTFLNEMTLSPIVNAEGSVTHYLGMFLDVTDREMTGQYLIDAKMKAEESAQLKSEFLASMSHEIRTPMNGVLGMIGLLLKSPLNKEQQHFGELARTSAESLLTIINDILDFSKVESGKLELESVEFNLIDQLGELIEMSAQRVNMNDVELILDTVGIPSAFVTGDSGRIRQIINNLISNAIKFTEKGEILVTANIETLDNGRLKFVCQVKDSGIGIPKDRLDKVFESFTQVDASTTRKYGGTGLGLTISKQLCELMGGSIRVSSEEGQGCEFEFDVRLEKAQTIPEPSVDLQGLTLLVMDKNSINQTVLTAQLEHWGAKVLQGNHVNEAVNLFNDEKIDLLLIDAHTPCLQDNTFYNALLHNQKNNGLKLVLMDRITDDSNVQYQSELTINASFSKPCTHNDLLEALNIALSEDVTLAPLIDPPLEQTSDVSIVQGLSGKRILLVEDNIINQTLALALLDEFGIVCDVANDGKEALGLLNAADIPYQLVLMDCQMPVMDGYQASGEIRLGKGGKMAQSVPIIAMTANAMKGDREKCINAGMDDYLSKPIDVEILQNKLIIWLIGEELNNDSKLSEAKADIINLEAWFTNKRSAHEQIDTIHTLKMSGSKAIAQLKQALDQHNHLVISEQLDQLKALSSAVYGVRFCEALEDFWHRYNRGEEGLLKRVWPELIKEFHTLIGALKQFEDDI
jgi:two-component system, sensor histidine kinase